MTHLAFREGPDVELEVDYVVVGTGAGGAAAGVSLARAGAEVALVEAGPWRAPEDYPRSVYGTMRDMLPDWGSTFTRGRAFWPVVQATLVGGSTVINSAICVRTPGDIFRRWEQEHGLAASALSERLWQLQDVIEQELWASEVPARARGKHNELAMLASQRLGMEGHYMRRYVRDCEGAGQCLQGCRSGRKQSLNLNYVPEVLQRSGVLLSCAPVAKICMEGARATGVRGRFRHPQHRRPGARFHVRARCAVVVAASVTHSPLLLRRSGVRLPALGRHFRAHPGAPVVGVYDEPIDMNTGATQGWASLQFRDEPGFKLETLSLPLDMYAGRVAGGGAQLMARLTRFRHFAMWVQACRAETQGRVGAALNGRPAVRYTLGRADMERFVAGLQHVARMHFAAGAKAVLPGIYGLPYELGPDQVSQLEQAPRDPRAYVAVLSHLFGGCTMGQDPQQSVCDPRGQVRGRQGLYVADASLIPTNLGVNPQHTIMALAQYVALGALETHGTGRSAA